jgi:hypothetical protein
MSQVNTAARAAVSTQVSRLARIRMATLGVVIASQAASSS